MTTPSGAAALPTLAAGRSSPIGAIDTRTPVLVLSASPRARRSPHGGLGILRTLGRLGIPVYTVDSDPRGPASYSKYLRGRFVFDLDVAEAEATVDYLLDVGRRLGSRAVLIPTWDEMSLLVSDSYDALSERFLLPHQPERLARSLASKKEMFRLARQHSVPTPESVFPTGVGNVREFAAAAAFPVMLKGIVGNRLQQRTGRKMVIVERPDELIRMYAEMEDPDDPNLMLQEYIPGGDDDIWMFNGYFDHQSDCLVGFTGRKLRQTPVYTGATSLGVCVQNDVVDETTRRWMKELGYRGILDIGYRYDARDGRYKVLDVNPRIGGTFRLFVAHNGMDVARALYLDLTGQPVPRAEQVEGRKWMDERDVISCLQYRRDHRLTVRQWVTSLGGVQETVHFARDDMAPFWRAWTHVLGSAASRLRASLPSIRLRRQLLRSDGQRLHSRAHRQHQVHRLFHSTARDWKTIYDEQTVYGVIHQQRRATAMDWIDKLDLPVGAPVLEVGCGAGLAAAALAERGFSVTAIDATPAMIELTEQLMRDRNLTAQVRTRVADAHHIPAADGAYALVVGLGVLPWLHSPDEAMAEMARVLQPGGYVLANVDNLLRLHYLLDPRLNPVLGPLRRFLGGQIRRWGMLGTHAPTPVHLESPWRFDAVLARLGLVTVRTTTIGFGPFTYWKRPVLSGPEGIRLHHALQGLADRGVPLVRSTGAQYLVLARKPEAAGPGSGPVTDVR